MRKDQEWLARHLYDLAREKFAGEFVAVADRKIVAHGVVALEVEREAKKKCPGEYISVLPIPREEDLIHVL